jgi:hypothetical protein
MEEQAGGHTHLVFTARPYYVYLNVEEELCSQTERGSTICPLLS